MAWFLQTPDGASPKLLAKIIDECGPASKGGAAFAFASATGVQLLTVAPVFQKFLTSSSFDVVIGLDAITDTKAIDELRKVKEKHPNFKPKLFLHGKPASCFHPKTMWLKTPSGGVIITGSGNLTLGGLKGNWEAMAIEKMTVEEMTSAEAAWNAWLIAHKNELLDLDDAKAVEKAKSNKVHRAKIKKALKLPLEEGDAAEAALDAVEEAIEEIEQDLSLNPVLIAEVPKSGDRWKQINFDVQTYQQFFGVTLGSSKSVEFYHIKKDGSPDAAEHRHAVAVKSLNYRFEVGAAHGLAYPTSGHPIVIFEKISDATFKYVLLMPSDPEHNLIQNYIDTNFAKTKKKRRIVVTSGDLKKVWPGSPLFI